MTHGEIKLAASHGGTFAADGYGYPYVRAVCFASLLWAFVGVAAPSGRPAQLRREPRRRRCGRFWLASPLFWYTVYEPTMPHAVALGAVALFLTAWLRARDHGGFRAWGRRSRGRPHVSVQRYDAFYLLLPALTFAGRFRDLLRGGTRFDSKGNFACVLAILFGLAIGTAPLWMFQLATEGSLLRRVSRSSRSRCGREDRWLRPSSRRNTGCSPGPPPPTWPSSGSRDAPFAGTRSPATSW